MKRKTALLLAHLFFWSTLLAWPAHAATVIKDLIVKESPWVDVRAHLAIPDDNSAFAQSMNVVTIQAAADNAVALGKPLYISGRYAVTSSAGGYALIFKGPVFGDSPTTSVILNLGTGSAVKWENQWQTDAGYYYKMQNFSIIGNASSQDGFVLNPTDNLYKANSYGIIDSVYVHGHGRNGVVHWGNWATKYINSKFYENGGLGFWLHGSSSDNINWHNNITFTNCESRWNGGTGAIGVGDFGHAGYRLDGGMNGVHFFGGVTESNNNWDFVIGLNWATGNIHTQQLTIKAMNFEDTPRKNGTASYSTTGGKFRIHGSAHELVDISHNHIIYGAGTGGTGYFIYSDNTTTPGGFIKEHDNLKEAYGGGTNTLYGGDNKLRLDWQRPYASILFGDLDAGDNTAMATKILSAAADGSWSVNGWLSCKKYNQASMGTYYFSASRHPSAGGGTRQVALDNTNVHGTAPTIPPTMAWNGGDLEVTTGIAHWCSATLDIGGTVLDPPDTFSLNTAIFPNDFTYRSRPQ